MTEKLYWKDAYIKEFDAKVARASGNSLVLDKTAFYATSGGQLNDIGSIVAGPDSYKVVDVKEENGEILHILDKECALAEGQSVRGAIDWQRRYGLMRHHTAMHMLSAVITTKYDPECKSTGGQIYPDKARMDFDMPTLNRELVAKIIEETNKVMEEDKKVLIKEVPSEDVRLIPNISRTLPGEELLKSLKTVRIVEIENLDAQIDGGTHVSSTKEVGKMLLQKFENNGKHNKRVVISLG